MSPSFCSPQICSNITFPEVSFLFVCCHKDVLMLRFCSDTTTTWLLWGKDPGFSIKSWFCRHQQAGTYQVTSNKYWNSATDSVLRLLDLWMWQRATETDKSERKRVFQKHINANFFILAPNVFFKGTFVSKNKYVVVKTNSTKSFLLRFGCFHVLMMNL